MKKQIPRLSDLLLSIGTDIGGVERVYFSKTVAEDVMAAIFRRGIREVLVDREQMHTLFCVTSRNSQMPYSIYKMGKVDAMCGVTLRLDK